MNLHIKRHLLTSLSSDKLYIVYMKDRRKPHFHTSIVIITIADYNNK